MRTILKTVTVCTLFLVWVLGIFYTTLIYMIYYFFYCKKPNLIYKKSAFNVKISQLKSLNKKFFPFVLAIWGILQTFLDRFRKMKKKTGCMVFEVVDGVFMVDDYQNFDSIVVRNEDYKEYLKVMGQNRIELEMNKDLDQECFEEETNGMKVFIDTKFAEDSMVESKFENNLKELILTDDTLSFKDSDKTPTNENKSDYKHMHKSSVQNKNFKDPTLDKNYIIERLNKRKAFYKNRNTILLIHGFNSSSDSNYIVSLANHLTNHYNVFAFNSKGTKLNLLTNKYFHIGYTNDVLHILNFLLTITDGYISIIGFSLGANCVAILLSKINNDRIKCGVGVSMPFDFVKLNAFMMQSFYSIINRVMTNKMKNFFMRHRKTFIVYEKRIIGNHNMDRKIVDLEKYEDKSGEEIDCLERIKDYISRLFEKFKWTKEITKSDDIKYNIMRDKNDTTIIACESGLGYNTNQTFTFKDKIDYKSKDHKQVTPSIVLQDTCNMANNTHLDNTKSNPVLLIPDKQFINIEEEHINIDEQLIKDDIVSNLSNEQMQLDNALSTTSSLPLSFEELLNFKFNHEIDENVTTKIYNFPSLKEFHNKGSSINYLHRIKVPFLILNACDDPVVPISTIDFNRIKETDHVFAVMSQNGGHLGFMGYDWETNYAEEIILEFLDMCYGENINGTTK